MIVEDDENGGCSWCPVVVEERKEDSQASIVYWEKGELLRGIKSWEDALELFSRGVAANSSNAKCWIGLSRVSARVVLKKHLKRSLVPRLC